MERAIRTITPFVDRYPTAFARWLTAIDLALGELTEVAIVGGADDPATEDLRRAAQAGPVNRRVVAWSPSLAPGPVPLLAGRVRMGAASTAYVCRDFACRLPVTDAEALRAELAVAEARAG